jgi:adenylosuccinate lyase
MLRLWSPRNKFNTWRKVWLAVAEAQHELGLPVTKEQVEELRAVVDRPGGITDAEIAAADRYERELRHDVMAHVHALGDSCPKARGIIHLGMTSQDVVCNADLQILSDATNLITAKVTRAILALGTVAARHARTPTLAFTHYQPAQPTTIGRRATQWAYELDLCLPRLHATNNGGAGFRRGLKGATGTQASFLALADGRHATVDQLEDLFMRSFGLDSDWHDLVQFTSQTYPRVIDTFILADLASTAAVLHKVATDIRLLCNRKELDEPFESKQIGSSAMPYKRNPMRCERIGGLARFVMNLVGNAYDTAATQWLERTLDDSANRRLSLPEAFLALDGALDLMHNVASGLIVHEAMVRKNLMAELPFMATENILMACVQRGGDRQHYHELLRVHAQAAGLRVKQEGADNDLLDRLKADPAFHGKARNGPLSSDLDWDNILDPMKYIGRSVEQTERFIAEVVDPLRAQYADQIAALDDDAPCV